ncbi:general stress protein [Pseudomonas aeruginosa]|uniref:general stress protein n=1 Tax=Pseudomonas aeruginosa TaxID=287 RepID=UPI00062835C8|nr:general stress protein [Pseudomonas aeruginosa]MDP5647309.1 general stress protein [Pseudomonas aeruginosa]RQE62948.1 stress-induced protein [Pseudomonas aeruginosa]HCF4094232.1 general stress protein [Pseudomonas aeruginosa]
MTDKRQGMSTSEAGQKGGAATSRSHGKEFYQEIGHKGGQQSGGNFANDPERAAEAGRKGGQQSGGNFANDREKASEAGRKGGQHSHGGGRSS